jgi:hypothetical protein
VTAIFRHTTHSRSIAIVESGADHRLYLLGENVAVIISSMTL